MPSMQNQSDTERLAEAVANIATTITDIIEAKIRAGAKPSESVCGEINRLTWAEGWVGKKEAAQHLSISQRTVDNWMRKGLLPYIRLGRAVRFKLSEVDEA